jgi:heme/copper-type cytochrome/quinol oxidase subunit 3
VTSTPQGPPRVPSGNGDAPEKIVEFKLPEAPPVEHEDPKGAGTFGMLLFLLSLTVLFVSSLIGIIIVRFQAGEQWRSLAELGLPKGLWVSTAIILGASWAVHRAMKSLKAGDLLWATRWLMLTFGGGFAFLILQALNWFLFVKHGITGREDLFGFSFYVLTGLHALHVIGGLIQLGIVAARTSKGRYTAEEPGGVWYSALYWHFLDGAWVVIFLALLLVL